ncbi:DUF1206 domain-containing protein [Rhodobacteraceae bacterium CCMM004]|nr:DUF1206 domain-containing protein [Rhodobacteraceae bacterium CCMM004]
MRAGYGGRALVYLAVAGLSLWAIWRGGDAQGTESAFATLERSTWGVVVLVLIAIGMAAYALWRLIDALWDLEDYGTDGKGLIARIGMVVTGLVHLALGAAVVKILLGSGDGEAGGEGQSGVSKLTSQVMSMPGGVWLVGIAGVCTLGAAIYYLHKAWKEEYRDTLYANEVLSRWNWVLKAGVTAQGIIVGVIGGFLLFAALNADPSEAGGVGEAFDWLAQQPFGNVLVVLICIGLLGFAVFCAVNAAYRIVPKAADGDIRTLADKMREGARRAKAKAT